MRRKQRLLGLMMVLILSVGAMAGCAKKATVEMPSAPVTTPDKDKAATDVVEPTADPVTLKIYAQYADEDTKIPYDYAVEALKEAYPHVTLELDIQAQDDGQKLQTYAATGNLPDIFQVGLQQIETFKKSGNIMILNDIAKSTGFEDKVHEGAKSILYNEDGNIYAFPYAGNELVVWYYNKALFEQHNLEVPKTYDDLLNVIEVFKANDIIPMSLFAKEKWITAALYDAFATRYNKGGIDALDKGEAKASDEDYAAATNKLHELVKAGLLPDGATNLNYDQAAALFYEGKAAMFLNGQWEIEGSTEKLGDNADWMFYPALDAESYEASKTVWAGGGAPGGYAVNPQSPNKELAAEVAAFISEKYCEAKYALRSNPMLAVEVNVTPEKPFPAMMQKLADEIPKITSTTKFAWGLTNPQIKTAIEDYTQFLTISDYTPEEFTSELDKVIERVDK